MCGKIFTVEFFLYGLFLASMIALIIGYYWRDISVINILKKKSWRIVMLRKILVGWSIGVLLFFGVKILIILFQNSFQNEYVMLSMIVTVTISFFLAGQLFLDVFLTKKNEDCKPRDVGMYLAQFG